jgi:3-hexulose-6-phosphate synthase/6-phospho-3-hexuloisomerase
MKEIAGVVIDGGIRDVEDIREMQFPAFARYMTSAAGEPKGFGEINIEIICGGVKVAPGDWIVGDDNGVMVIPKDKARLATSEPICRILTIPKTFP